MAELADAHGSGPCESNFMQVQVLLPAPEEDTQKGILFFYYYQVWSLATELEQTVQKTEEGYLSGIPLYN